MKKLLQILTLFVLINSSFVIVPEKLQAQAVSFQVFYDDLSPYGSWYESPDYGYVWRPSLSGFTPYATNGHWVLTDYGWTWVSNYSWGWAPFHYGRWYYDPLYGYVWVPGYEWGPGWVTWRRSDNYYGWAPIGPGVSISMAYSNGYNVPYNHWNFVNCNNLGRRDIHNYYIDRSKNVTIINNTTVINTTKVDNTRNTTYNPGPDRAEVQKKVGRNLSPVAIVDENKPTQRLTKNSVQLYRPVIEKRDAGSTIPAPKKVIPRNATREQAVKERAGRENEARDDQRSKQVQGQPADRQKTKQNNELPVKEAQERPEKKPIRDEQPSPVRRAPIEQPGNDNNPQRDKQHPVLRSDEQPVPKQREEQLQQQQRSQRSEQPPVQQPERIQRKEQSPPPQPDRPQRTEQRPVQQQPDRQQQVPPQRVERPAPPQQPVRQQPQQAPAQRQPVQRQPVPQQVPKG